MSSTKFKRGAICFMDALGFKGIWRRHSIDDVVAKVDLLEAHRDRVLAIIADAAQASGRSADMVSILFLSDSIVLAIEDDDPRRAVTFALTFAGYLQSAAASDQDEGRQYNVQLTYRGAIAYGDYYARANCLIGPAVDEAGGNMEKAEGAFVWLGPSARSVYRPRTSNPIAIEWPVPLKKAEPYSTWAASPLTHTTDPDDTLRLILDTFESGMKDENPDIAASTALKRRNTEPFLRAARDAAVAYRSQRRG